MAIAALSRLDIVIPIETTVELAIEFHERIQIRYWDALIVATARLGGCGVVLSEDLSDG